MALLMHGSLAMATQSTQDQRASAATDCSVMYTCLFQNYYKLKAELRINFCTLTT